MEGVLISTKENAWILDPFAGSSTTGIAANLLNRRFLGLEQEEKFLELSKKRREEIEDISKRYEYREKIIKYSGGCRDPPIRFRLQYPDNFNFVGEGLCAITQHLSTYIKYFRFLFLTVQILYI